MTSRADIVRAMAHAICDTDTQGQPCVCGRRTPKEACPKEQRQAEAALDALLRVSPISISLPRK